jgi:Na+/H+ antiporter NhaD/arsenite permease-like protein
MLVFERLLIVGSAVLAFSAVAMGHVRLSEVPGLLDMRLLALFLVLTIAVELGKVSGLFDRLVVRVTRRLRTARGLAFVLVAATAVLAALLTNDVALFLVVPFTMLLRDVEGVDPAPLVVLEVLSANLLGAVTPIGSPQNLFLYSKGFTLASFLTAQAHFAAAAGVCLLAAVILLVGRVPLVPPAREPFDVDPLLAGAFVVILAAQCASLFGPIPHTVPLVLAAIGALLLGRRLFEANFGLIAVFAFLFVGVAGLERGHLYRALDLGSLFGHHASGMLLSGATLSQVVSNVPAAMLLAPAANGPQGLVALLWGVSAGACGSPFGSIANLIGAQIYQKEGGDPRRFWRLFLPVSSIILVVLVLYCLAVLTTESSQ